MHAEPQDFQCATPTGFAEQATHDQAGVDQSRIHVFADDRIGASSISSGWHGKAASTFAYVDDLGRMAIGIRSIERLREILNRFRVSIAVRSSAIGGALVVAFGLGWACALMLNSNPGAGSARLNQDIVASVGRLDYEKQHVRRNHSIAKPTVALNPHPEPNRPKLSAAPASVRLSSSGLAQMQSEPQSAALESVQQRISLPATLSASSDSNLPVSPVPETKPTTIAGWTVREVNGETAVLAGPDHVWTVRTGDAVPGLGRIDSIVLWGNRWIVATSAGLISTE